MSINFGTENIVFVPPGGLLRVYDLQRWQVLAVDALHAVLAATPTGADAFSAKLESSLGTLRASKRFSPRAAEFGALGAELDEALLSRPRDADPEAAGLAERLAAEGFVLWARVSDAPAESFAEEDYDEHQGAAPGPGRSLPLYGSLHIERMDDFESAVPRVGAEAPFVLTAPEERGFAVAPIPVEEPLPLVHEFCGARGASSRGNSVNLSPKVSVEPEHILCAPLHRVGRSFFATLYGHLSAPAGPPVLAKLDPRAMRAVAAVLERSRYEAPAGGADWRCYRRGGDAVHLYYGLPGKESDGVFALPGFAVAASADGSHLAEPRAELLRMLLDAALGAQQQ
ncbi:MAG: hypothetical protein SF028_13150 [Candidatus Sumerlaeia bacterium]|nr:hypothetical protein [Candidatus Sumerlaeia bacterium]